MFSDSFGCRDQADPFNDKIIKLSPSSFCLNDRAQVLNSVTVKLIELSAEITAAKACKNEEILSSFPSAFRIFKQHLAKKVSERCVTVLRLWPSGVHLRYSI